MTERRAVATVGRTGCVNRGRRLPGRRWRAPASDKDATVNELGPGSGHIAEEAQAPSDALYGWRGGGIVLLGDYRDERWTIARGWVTADAMTDVRRWTFAAPSAFAGQVRRLVLEASGDGALARVRGAEALRWATTVAQQPVA
jgi:hypothetical protein